MVQETHVITGAYGYSGKYMARRLLKEGITVKTVTNSYKRANPFGDKVKAYPFNFDKPEKLVEALRGATVLYNTYWVRFNYTTFKHSVAVDNILTLFEAAKEAGIERIIHTSITNPSLDSPYEYFSGKAIVEKALIESGMSYAILRPAILFGMEDILINNITYVLRKLPFFPVFGKGDYRLQPIHVDDFAKLAIEQGKSRENVIIDAIGPETFTFTGLVKEIKKILGIRRLVFPIPRRIAYIFGKLGGKLVGDVLITDDEVDGLMADLLYTKSPPAGQTKLTDWIKENSSTVGRIYHSELARRKDRTKSYARLIID
jgi:NADH dehydrogenase